MSKGLGRLQREILTALVEAPSTGLETDALVVKVFGQDATVSQVTSVRRAIRELERDGLVSVRRQVRNVVRLTRKGR